MAAREGEAAATGEGGAVRLAAPGGKWRDWSPPSPARRKVASVVAELGRRLQGASSFRAGAGVYGSVVDEGLARGSKREREIMMPAVCYHGGSLSTRAAGVEAIFLLLPSADAVHFGKRSTMSGMRQVRKCQACSAIIRRAPCICSYFVRVVSTGCPRHDENTDRGRWRRGDSESFFNLHICRYILGQSPPPQVVLYCLVERKPSKTRANYKT